MPSCEFQHHRTKSKIFILSFIVLYQLLNYLKQFDHAFLRSSKDVKIISTCGTGVTKVTFFSGEGVRCYLSAKNNIEFYTSFLHLRNI